MRRSPSASLTTTAYTAARGARLLALLACLAATLTTTPVARASDAAAGPAKSSGTVVRGELGHVLDDALSRFEGAGFSGAILAAVGGEVVIAKGYGLADRERGIPFTTDTVFTVGSISKQFTAAAILALEMQGKLSVHDPISKFFPDAPADRRDITLHHLMTHTAALPDIASDVEPLGRDDFVRRMFGARLLHDQRGERMEYSNGGYGMLAAVIEVASGMSYDQYLHETLFVPAGMHRTGHTIPEWNDERIAVSYLMGTHIGATLKRPAADDGPWFGLRGSGGIHSTVWDMYRWKNALHGDTVLSDEARAKATTPHVPFPHAPGAGYGYGWGILRTPRDTLLVEHDGMAEISAAVYRDYVDDDVFVFLASNADVVSIEVLESIAPMLFGQPAVTLPPPLVSDDVAKRELDGIAGRYAFEDGGHVDVIADGDRLLARAEGQSAYDAVAPMTRMRKRHVLRQNDRVEVMLREASRGNYDLQAAMFGHPEGSFDERGAEHWKIWRAEHGEVKDVRVLGTMPHAERGMTCTTARLDFERGSFCIRYGLANGTILGYRIGEVPQIAFVPQGDGRFSRFTFSQPLTILRFERDADGTVTRLLAGEGPDAAVATRVDSPK